MIQQFTRPTWASQLSHARHRTMLPDEERAAFEKLAAGDEGQADRIINSNIKFAYRVALNYTGQGLSLEDLMGEACAGMMKALRHFNPAQRVHGKPVKFISYAVWWIRQSIISALTEQVPALRFPKNHRSITKRMSIARMKMEQRLGRTVSIDELKADIGSLKYPGDNAVLEMSLLGATVTQAYCLNEMMAVGHDFTADIPATDAPIARQQEQIFLEEMMGVLKPRDREIVRRFYGLTTGEEETLEAIGQRFGVSRERVRQIVAKAMKRLKRTAALARAKEQIDTMPD